MINSGRRDIIIIIEVEIKTVRYSGSGMCVRHIVGVSMHLFMQLVMKHVHRFYIVRINS